MKTIHNIVVAEPALAPSYEAIAYALGLARDLKAKLTIGLCFDYEKEARQDKSFSEREEVGEAFRYIRSHLLQGTSVDYRLVSVDRSLCEDVEAPLDAYHPDLMVIATAHVAQLHLLIEQVKCPLLLVPLQAKYHPIREMAVAYDATTLPHHVEVIPYIARIAQNLEACIHIVEISPEQVTAALQEQRANVELDYLLKENRHQFHFLEGKDVEQEIIHLVGTLGMDLLVMLARQHIPSEEQPEARHTVGIAQKISIPLIVLKI